MSKPRIREKDAETIVFDRHTVYFIDTLRRPTADRRIRNAAGCRYGRTNGTARVGRNGGTPPSCRRHRLRNDTRRLHGLRRRTQSQRPAADLCEPQLPPGVYRIDRRTGSLDQRIRQRHDKFRPFGRPRNQYLHHRRQSRQLVQPVGADSRFRRIVGNQHRAGGTCHAAHGHRGAATGPRRSGAERHAGLLRRGVLHRKRPAGTRTAADERRQSAQEPQTLRTGVEKRRRRGGDRIAMRLGRFFCSRSRRTISRWPKSRSAKR